jgi:flagellar basal-body rod modification protein FlgD
MSMTIGSTLPPAGTSATEATSKTAVDYQSFLRLLVAEMKNQDPTNPMDSTQYVAQLASFSQVEQSVQINSKLGHHDLGCTLADAGHAVE